MGFDGKSLINPKQIRLVHEVFAPTEKEVMQAEKIVRAYREQSAAGVGVFTVDGKMIDIAFIPGAERTLRLARACGMYEGDLVAKQLLNNTWDVPMPQVVLVYLTGKPRRGVGPHDVAIALVKATFSSKFVNNKVLEFVGPGI